jgi:hypothetical protein
MLFKFLLKFRINNVIFGNFKIISNLKIHDVGKFVDNPKFLNIKINL